jgi:hypothetical protein
MKMLLQRVSSLRCARLLQLSVGHIFAVSSSPCGLHTTADAIVPDGWPIAVAALVEFTGIFLLQSF